MERRRFSRAFKLEAVRLVRERGVTVAEAARDLDVHDNVLRKVFETVVRRCMAEGLVGGDGFAVDASLIKADANKQRSAESRLSGR